jgi:hypothetical protein
LSWEAANERFAAAGCITEREAEEFNRLLASDEGGIEVCSESHYLFVHFNVETSSLLLVCRSDYPPSLKMKNVENSSREQ